MVDCIDIDNIIENQMSIYTGDTSSTDEFGSSSDDSLEYFFKIMKSNV